MNPYVAADAVEQLTIVTAGEARQVEHSQLKDIWEVPLHTESGERYCSFRIATYSYEARVIELRDIPREPCDIGPATYFEVYNPFSGKTERMQVSGDKLVDEGSLKHLLQRIGVELEAQEIEGMQ